MSQWEKIKANAAKILAEKDEHYGFIALVEEDDWQKIVAVIDALKEEGCGWVGDDCIICKALEDLEK